MQTAVNYHHFELIHNAYCGFPFSITREKFMKGPNYSKLTKTFVFHMKVRSQTQFGENLHSFKAHNLATQYRNYVFLNIHPPIP
jgi:hypothetical protein